MINNTLENRISAYRCLMDAKLAKMIQNCAMLDGKYISEDNIQSMLDNYTICLGGEYGDFIHTSANVIKTMNVRYNQPEDLYFIRDLYSNLRLHSDFRYKLAIEDRRVIQQEIHRINQIDVPMQRALVMFGYLIQREIFHDSNRVMAYLIANKILVHNGCGLLIASGNVLPGFVGVLDKFMQDGDGLALYKFIMHNCINRILA